MISSKTIKLSRHLYKCPIWSSRSFSTPGNALYDDKDPAYLFFDQDVQQGLRRLTRVEYEKVFKIRKIGKRLQVPTMKFMTDEELKAEYERAKKNAEKRLHIPPVVKPFNEEINVLSEDPALQGFSTSKYVFTDISYGISNKMRLIAVRDLDGTLRSATLEERNRVNQIYFPVSGRELRKPKMFQDEYLTGLMEKGEYEFILDRACAQFEPDDPEYQRITKQVYAHINENNKFEALRSTRHFGAMVFHFLWNNEIDNLLIEIIHSGHIDEAELLVRLYHKFYPSAKIITEEYENKDAVTLIMRYAEKESLKRQKLERILAYYEELQKEKRKIEKGIKRAHGLDVPHTDDTQP